MQQNLLSWRLSLTKAKWTLTVCLSTYLVIGHLCTVYSVQLCTLAVCLSVW
jgi:hypothetical protein